MASRRYGSDGHSKLRMDRQPTIARITGTNKGSKLFA